MSNPTSNFGWQMPTPTDLVTDLPADFEVFGQAVDTSLADLKGGTTGQVLSKTTNADMDFTWVAPTAGDIEGVTAGVGISGGGTSGTVTITNDMATTITASGDIVVGTGSGTYDNLPIGTTGQILTADTTVSPYKVKWATPSSGSTFNGARLWNTTTQNISNATLTSITFNSESYDTNSYHSTSSNTSRITIPTTGYYRLDGLILIDANATGGRYLTIRKNGTTDVAYYELGASTQTSVGTTLMISAQLSCAAADYFELQIYQTSGGTRNTYVGGEQYNYFSIQSLGA